MEQPVKPSLIKLISFSWILLLFSSCAVKSKNYHFSDRHEQLNQEYDIDPYQFAKLYTSIWMQYAAEYDALCYQAYNIATVRLEEAVNDPQNKGKKLAIVTDVDETVLNNSPFSVLQSLNNELYDSDKWMEWCNRSEAKPLAGSIEFFQKAKSYGVDVFYITNRNPMEQEGTVKNLKVLGYPNAEAKYVLCREQISNKDSRRALVASNYKIILYVGDNLGDFSSMFDNASVEERAKELRKIKSLIGKNYIVLPNPNYGTWEKALQEYKRHLSPNNQYQIFKHYSRTSQK